MKLPKPPRRFAHVPGFPGYAVNRSGVVVSCWAPGHWSERVQTVWHRMHPIRRMARGAFKRKARYYTIHVSRFNTCGRKRRIVAVHYLMLLTFVGPRPRGMEACHNNGRHTDNRRRNLRWDTPGGNRADQIAHGAAPMGEKAWNARLTTRAVRKIRASSEPAVVLAARYKVNATTVRDVLARRTWKHVRQPRGK